LDVGRSVSGKELSTLDVAGLDNIADRLLHVAGSSREGNVNTASGLGASLDASSEGVNVNHLQVTSSMVNTTLDEETSTGSLVNVDSVVRVGAGSGGAGSSGSSA
jgi:hypothetical protein